MTFPIFDFDGVICDGMLECLLVSFCVRHRLGVERFSAATVQSIPDSFKRGFARCRGFSRHVGHFVVAFGPRSAAVSTQSEFDALYARLAHDEVEDFVARVIAFREQLREQLPERWLAAQPLFPGIEQLLTALGDDFYIVSAKDAGSVRGVLDRHALRVGAERILGGCRGKLHALDACARREQRTAGEILVIDDNVFNVAEARAAGYRALWADWGYHGPDHRAWARSHGVVALSLHDFTSRSWSSGLHEL